MAIQIAPNPNSGSIDVGDGGYNDQIFVNNGTIKIGNEILFSNNAKILNHGLLYNLSGGNLWNSGTLHINIQGLLSNLGSLKSYDNSFLTVDKGGNVKNSGEVVSGGTIRNSGRIENSLHGAINNEGELTNDLNGVINNKGSVVNNGYVHNETRAIFKNNGFTNYGKLINKQGGIFECGSMFNTNGVGSVVNDGEMTIKVSMENWGDFDNTGEFSNSGSISNGNTSSLENSGSLINSSGSIISLDPGAIMRNEANGAIINNGKILSSGKIVNDGLIDNTNGLIKGVVEGGGRIVGPKLTGSGKISGNYVNYGIISPGNSAGGKLFDGTLTHQDKGLTSIELGGDSDASRDRVKSEYDFIDITGDLIINGGLLEVSLINDFKLNQNQEFIITKLDGELKGHYDGLQEGASVGQFESIHGFSIDLHISYMAGDGNDIGLYTEPFTNPEMIFGYS